MGGHGHGHHEPYKVPDPKIYKIEAPQLLEVQRALSRQGLSDPWLRNEAWRYLPQHKTQTARAIKFFTRGFAAGLLLAIISATVEKTQSGHGHDEHH